MIIVLITLFYCGLIFSSNQEVSWKDNFYVKEGKFHEAYQYQVFKFVGFPSAGFASLYCDQISKDHEYNYYPFKRDSPEQIKRDSPEQKKIRNKIIANNSRLMITKHLGFVSGYGLENVDFKTFKDSFERYCYWPCDGISAFYDHQTRVTKILSYIPFLNVLVPYWIKGERVLAIGVDQVTNFFNNEHMDFLMDIPFNVLYSDNDKIVTKESALVLWHQLKKGGKFTDVRLKRVKQDYTLVDETPSAVDNNLLKPHERMQWWLKHLWVSRLAVLLSTMYVVTKLTNFHIARAIASLLICFSS